MELPKKYVELDCEEMSYVEGGLKYGKSYNIVRLAVEIYTHAYLYVFRMLTAAEMYKIKALAGCSNRNISSVISYV